MPNIWNMQLWNVGSETMTDLPDLYQELGCEARVYLTKICIDLCSVESGLELKQMVRHVSLGSQLV